MPITLNGSTGIDTPDVTSSGALNISSTAPDNTIVANSSGNVGIGTGSPATRVHAEIASPTAYTTSSNGNILRLSNTTAGGYAGIMLSAEPSSGNGGIAALNCFAPGSGDGVLAISTRGGSTLSERARIDSNGHFLFGATSTSGLQTATSGGSVFYKESSGTSLWVTRGNGGGSTMNVGRTSGAGTGTLVEWFYNGTNTGTVTTNGTNTSYNTSSDYRLKEDVQPMTGALARIAALKPCTYKWKANGSTGEGFIAHELAEVVPDAVTGEKDAVNADGSIKPQGIDTSFLVATLTAAIQEQQAIIEQLKADVAALKGQA